MKNLLIATVLIAALLGRCSGSMAYMRMPSTRQSREHVIGWSTRALKRHFTLGTAGPPLRLKLELETTQVEVRHVAEVARDVATRHVAAFLDLLPKV